MTQINHKALREAAERAGGGLWQGTWTSVMSRHYITDRAGKTVINLTDGETPANCARFIELANPAAVLSLLDELEQSQQRVRELEAREVNLPALNDDLVAILGRPNFTCAHIAEIMRRSGDNIRRKSESEQAAVIHWLLSLYLEYGDKWESVAKAEMQRRVAGIKLNTEGE